MLRVQGREHVGRSEMLVFVPGLGKVMGRKVGRERVELVGVEAELEREVVWVWCKKELEHHLRVVLKPGRRIASIVVRVGSGGCSLAGG